MEASPPVSMTLSREENQARGLARYAHEFLSRSSDGPGRVVRDRTVLFFVDSVLCGCSAVALGTNAPTVLRTEALGYPDPRGATVLGCTTPVRVEKAVAANVAAVREWDANGTNFGYRPALGHTAGEFGHNDFYAVPVAAAQQEGLGGRDALRGMMLLDEIRGRLAEVFSLKSYAIDHVLHGGIASAITYGAMRGASEEQIESAIGMLVAHYVPWRAIRSGAELSDSKGASAALSTEAAVLCMLRSMAGFQGPRDIFRNPSALWRQFEPQDDGHAPFDLVLSLGGEDFAVMGMHFKLGLYEHQSAGALSGVISILLQEGFPFRAGAIESVRITAYEPAYGIIGDPAKRDPGTRQSADHSMVYIVATLLRKAIESAEANGGTLPAETEDDCWNVLMLGPRDYDHEALHHPVTRGLMQRITFEHGGSEFDDRYPEGIPTAVSMITEGGGVHESGLVMFPPGHARNDTCDLDGILGEKFTLHGNLALADGAAIIERMQSIEDHDPATLASLWDLDLLDAGRMD